MTIRNFVPVLWSTKIMQQLYKAQVYGQCVNRDYEGEIKKYGDTVRVNTLGLPTISDYVPYTFTLTPEQLQGAGEALTIDQVKYYDYAIDDVDSAQVTPGIMDQANKNAAYALRDTTDTFLATTLAAGVAATAAGTLYNGTSVSSTSNPILVGTGATLTDAFTFLTDMNTLMNENNVPPNDRWVVVPPRFARNLILDVRFSSFATAVAANTTRVGATMGGSDGSSGDGFGALAEAFKVLVGFDLKISNNVPSTGTAPNKIYTILGGYKGACSYAEQIPEGHPEAFRPQGGFSDAMKSLHLYGAKVFRPDGLVAGFAQFA